MNQRRQLSADNDRLGINNTTASNNNRGSLSKHKKKGKWSLDITFIITVIIVAVTFGFFIMYSEQTLEKNLQHDKKQKKKKSSDLILQQKKQRTPPPPPPQQQKKKSPEIKTTKKSPKKKEDDFEPSPAEPTGTEIYVDSTACHNVHHSYKEGRNADKLQNQDKICQSYYPLLDLQQAYGNQSFKKEQPHIPKLLHRLQSQENDVDRMIASGAMVLTRQGVGLSHDVNQDRSIVISPFYVVEEREENEYDFVMGVFDGHGENGEYTSHYAVKHLPGVLSQKLEARLKNLEKKGEEEEKEEIIKQALVDTFHQVDSNLSRNISNRGGATGTVTYRHSSKLYIANIGDSYTLVLTHNPTTKQTNIIYKTREDKPHLVEERKRIESMGGMVRLPPPWLQDVDSSRVMKPEGQTQLEGEMIYALAMSRSFGDLEMKKIGVIATPIVDVLDLEEVRMGKVGIDGDDVGKGDGNENEEKEDLQVFVIAATDGLFQKVTFEDVANKVAAAASSSSSAQDKSDKKDNQMTDNQTNKNEKEGTLQKKDAPLLITCEEIILESSDMWRRLGMRFPGAMEYRDDMTIAVMRVR